MINVLYEMDRAAGLFANLGFHLTERGYHSIGSINHLMMFRTDYLELIGLPPESRGEKPARPDVANSLSGINGLVFKTLDVDETHAHLQSLGMDGEPPRSFTRPVTLPDGTKDARFRSVHVRNGIFPGGRVYFCEHGTPELVWRPEWQNHRNGVVAILEFVIGSQANDREAEKFARLLHSDVVGSGDDLTVQLDGAHITLLSPRAYRERYGDLATSMASRTSIFGALVLRSDDLTPVRDVAANVGMPSRDSLERVVIREPSFDSVLEFVG